MTSPEAGNGFRRGGTEPFDTGGPGWGEVDEPGPAHAHDLGGTYGRNVARGLDNSGGAAPLGRRPVGDGAHGDVDDPQGPVNSGNGRGGRAEPGEDDAQRTSWEPGDGFNTDTQMVALGSSRRASSDDGWLDDIEPPGERTPRHGSHGAVPQDRSPVDRQGEGPTPEFGADVDGIEDDGPLAGSPGGVAERSTGFRYTPGPGITTDVGAPQTGDTTAGGSTTDGSRTGPAIPGAATTGPSAGGSTANQADGNQGYTGQAGPNEARASEKGRAGTAGAGTGTTDMGSAGVSDASRNGSDPNGPVASAPARNPVRDAGDHALRTAEQGNGEPGDTGVRAQAALGTGSVPQPRSPVPADDPLTGPVAGGGDEIGGAAPGRDVYRVPENDGSGYVGLAQGDESAAVEGRRGRRAAPDADDDRPLGPGDVTETRIRVWGDEAIGEYRAEWHEVKAQFVDDPVTALARAHDLLTEAVHELSDALLAERDELDPLRRTASRDTETMRVAMRGYREFLDRILAL